MAGARHDWVDWHRPYDDPGSPLSRRLALVQARIAEGLQTAPAGPLRVISVCAGQGRDLLGVLPGHPRRRDVAARLVELDARNCAVARSLAARAGLDGVEIVTGDASTTDAYAGAVPAQVVVMAGVFGNISDADVRRTVGLLPTLCAPGATVIWTRHRRPPDLTPAIRGWLADAGFTQVWISPPDEDSWIGVGSARLTGQPRAFPPATAMFTFGGGAASNATPQPYR
jgi:hypothetical protein